MAKYYLVALMLVLTLAQSHARHEPNHARAHTSTHKLSNNDANNAAGLNDQKNVVFGGVGGYAGSRAGWPRLVRSSRRRGCRCLVLSAGCWNFLLVGPRGFGAALVESAACGVAVVVGAVGGGLLVALEVWQLARLGGGGGVLVALEPVGGLGGAGGLGGFGGGIWRPGVSGVELGCWRPGCFLEDVNARVHGSTY
ncbi:uncharacterized protein A4U43_C03F11260 [Asparagus officinalis]|uniref:Uncharacterized protein n=1 Tax=Asparagus officinalis TaxID=4686 RepID=A0A5P1FDE6_ASPOF|nr:uncharacterized protein A4U43_C03F11260 [Asparagus officinalis]